MLSPEEQLLRDLVNLAMTIRDDGQVNPLTVVDVSQGATRLVSHRNRRAALLGHLAAARFHPRIYGRRHDPLHRHSRTAVFRFSASKENTARAGLTAVALARQAALLLLTVHGYEIPAYAVSNDFYRQALDLDLRSKREYHRSDPERDGRH